ncbi:hypothetical protein GQ472_03915 [archaeon]|nr:hypothetical protein [archaeon]
MEIVEYQTEKLRDWKISEKIAEEVRNIFDKGHLVNSLYNSIENSIDLREGKKIHIYSYNTATVIVTEWTTHECIYSEKKMYNIGVVSCRWACDNPIVDKYITEQLDKIEGIEKDIINYNLP